MLGTTGGGRDGSSTRHFWLKIHENKQRALLERKRREREKEEKKAKRISIASCSHMEKDLGGGDLESLLHNNRNSFRQRNSRQGEGSIPRSQSLKQIRARSEQNDSRNGSLTRDDAQRLREVSKKLLGFQVGAENSGQRHKQSKFAQTSRISEEYCEPAKASTTPSNGHAEVGQEQKERLLGSGVSGVPAVGESEQSGSLEPAATQHPGSLVPVKAQQTGSLDPVKAQQPGSLDPVKTQQPGSLDPVKTQQPGSLVPVKGQQTGSLVPVKAQQTGSLDPAAAQHPGSLVPVKAQQPGSLVPVKAQ
eukprot:g25066.t1